MAVDGIGNAAVQGGTPVAGTLLPRQQGTPAGRQSEPAPAYLVDISPEARSGSLRNRGDGAVSSQGVSDNKGAEGTKECQTCKNRRYVDRSNDSTVSFQSPTKLTPGAAEGAVRAHEQEHVSNEQAKATEQGQRVVFQSVSIQYSICPECGRSYVSGGTTTTVTKPEARPGTSPGGSVDLTV